MKNKHVKEFVGILQQNDVPGKQDMMVMLQQIVTMEKHLDAAISEIAAMRKELNEAWEHPVKTALENSVNVLEKNVSNLRIRLGQLKEGIIQGCKKAVAAFKKKGISALNSMARFFKLRPALEAVGRSLDKAIDDDKRAIDKIEAVSTEYHEAGRHVRNMVRALIGKEAITDAKSNGKLAKALEAPFKRELLRFAAMRKSVNKSLSRLGQLEERAAQQKKPSIQDKLDTLNAQIKQAQQAQSRQAPAQAER